MMKNIPISWLLSGVSFAILAGCAETEPDAPEPPAPPVATELASPASGSVFDPLGSQEPPPADQVFFPEADADDGQLHFRIQTLPGYYLYKDHITLRVLTDAASTNNLQYVSPESTVTDEWFGEQTVFFLEASATADLEISDDSLRSIDVELRYRGCKEKEICYLPVTKVITVALPAG